MSLLQDALEKAKQPEKKSPLTLRAAAAAKLDAEEKVQPKPEIEHEPRLDSIKFYETLDKKVEEDLDEIRPTRAKEIKRETVFVPPAPKIEIKKQEVKKPEIKKPVAVPRPIEPDPDIEKLPVYANQPETTSQPIVTKEPISWQTPVLIFLILLASLMGVRYLVMHTPVEKQKQPRKTELPSLKIVPPPVNYSMQNFRIQPPMPTSVVKTQTASSNTKSFSQVRFLLTGITSYQDGRAFALINNQAVSIGDRLRENATVTSIQNDTVILDLDGQEIRLTL